MNRDAPDHAVRIALIDLNGGVPNRAIALLRHKLRGAGLKIVDFDPRVDGRLPNGSVDALLLTGGPGDPLAPEPWRRRLQTSLAASRLPVLGICLGFQVLAAAHGWRLQLVDQPRFGLIGLRPTAAGRRDRRAAAWPSPPPPRADAARPNPEGGVVVVTPVSGGGGGGGSPSGCSSGPAPGVGGWWWCLVASSRRRRPGPSRAA